MADDSLSFIPTKGSKVNKKAMKDFKAEMYTSYKSKTQNKNQEVSELQLNETKTKEFNIKQAKHEVIKFGMSGFTPQKKEEAMVQLLLRLGAKPRKNKAKNYKELLEEKRKEKKSQKTQLDLQQLGKNSQGASTVKTKFNLKKKEKLNVLEPYGRVNVKENTNKQFRKFRR